MSLYPGTCTTCGKVGEMSFGFWPISGMPNPLIGVIPRRGDFCSGRCFDDFCDAIERGEKPGMSIEEARYRDGLPTESQVHGVIEFLAAYLGEFDGWEPVRDFLLKDRPNILQYMVESDCAREDPIAGSRDARGVDIEVATRMLDRK